VARPQQIDEKHDANGKINDGKAMLDQSRLRDLLQGAISLAQKAGHKILQIYDSNFGIDRKGDNSPLTAADLASHRCLVAGLRELAGSFPVLSEESEEVGYDERKGWQTYWLIDPLDGTKEFIQRNGEFTVNIALIHEHEPVLGVVYVPVTQQCYFAASTYGAFKQIGDQAPQRIRVRKGHQGTVVVVGSRSHQSPALMQFLGKLGGCDWVSMGSSLKFCLVAEGKADLYPRLSPTSEWDTAAAQCVVEQAEGWVTDLRGAPLRYNTKPSFLNPSFLAYGDERRDWKAYADSNPRKE
jgi:3'(2'), 5'-bisphosphate nucleotidase